MNSDSGKQLRNERTNADCPRVSKDVINDHQDEINCMVMGQKTQ